MEYDKEKIREKLRQWQERLLDLTRSNPLLGLNRSRVSRLRIVQPAATQLFRTFVLEDDPVLRMPIVRRKTQQTQAELTLEGDDPTFEVDPGDMVFDASPVDLMRRLRRIYDNARTTIEERGVTTLFLTFGLLKWRDDALGESSSSLWLVPCELTRTGPTTALRLTRADEEMQLNPALEVYLRERHKVRLPSLPEEPHGESLFSLSKQFEALGVNRAGPSMTKYGSAPSPLNL